MKKKVLLRGPFLTRSGYGEQARFALRSLQSKQDLYDIYLIPINWGQTSWVSEYDEEKNWIDETIEKTMAHTRTGGTFDVSIQVTIPNEFEQLAPINIGYTAGIETTKVSPEWIQQCNKMNKLLVVSNHAKDVFEATQYIGEVEGTKEKVELKTTVPINVVNYPVKNYETVDMGLELKYDFNFLCVAQLGPRKNLGNTIKYFVEEFHDEEVGLVVKTNMSKNSLMDRNATLVSLKNLLNHFPDRKCSVHLLHGDLTDQEMHSLYKADKIKAFVCLSHGEGYGLPFFESLYSGTPVVAVGWSGQCDFLFDKNNKEMFYDVAFDLQPVPKEAVWDTVIMADSMWSYARESAAKEKLRECYNDVINNTGHAAKSEEYSNYLNENFSAEKMYKNFCDSLFSEEQLEWDKTLSEVELV